MNSCFNYYNMRPEVGVSIDPLIIEMTDLQEVFEVLLAEDMGFKHIELHTEYLDKYIGTFLKLLETTGLKYTLHVPHDARKKVKVKLCSSLEKDIKFSDYWLIKSIDFAKDLNAKLLTIHPDRPVNSTKEKAKNVLKQHILKALEHMDSDMKLLLENMPADNYTITTPEEMKDFIRDVGIKQVGCTWDIAHSVLAIGSKFLEFPKILKNHIRNVHLCDVKGDNDHLPLGTGTLDLTGAVNSLSKMHYSDVINLEIVTNNPLDIVNSKSMVEKLIK